MSDGYDGREILVGLTGGSVSVPNNTSQKITGMSIDSRSKDTTASWDAANSRFIVPVSGFYRITGHGEFTTNASAGTAINAIQLRRNGAFIGDIARRDSLAAENQNLTCFVTGQTNPLYLVAGDILEFYAFQNSGVTRTFNGIYFSIERISSPQTIAMGEVVAGYATNSSGQSIPNASFTAVTNWSVVNDTHGIFNPSTGVLTVNKSGFIEIASSLVFNPNASGGRSSAIERNGSNLTINDYPTVSGLTISVPIGLASYPVKAGDTFKIKAFQNSGGNLSLAASSLYNYISWRIY
jgi:hypothetical protein